MNHPVVTSSGSLTCHCIRLHRGDDLMLSIKALCREKNIAAGVVLSAVGCISQGRGPTSKVRAGLLEAGSMKHRTDEKA